MLSPVHIKNTECAEYHNCVVPTTPIQVSVLQYVKNPHRHSRNQHSPLSVPPIQAHTGRLVNYISPIDSADCAEYHTRMSCTSRGAELAIYSRGSYFSQNLTELVREMVHRNGFREGLVHVNAAHTTCGLFLLEYEMGILSDLKQRLERVATSGFSHHRRGVDRNGGAHVISALAGTQQTITVRDGDLLLGTYQDLVFVDFEDQPRVCTVAIQFLGEFSS